MGTGRRRPPAAPDPPGPLVLWIVSRRRRLQLLAGWAVFLLLGASIYLGPYFAAWRIREAVAAGDTRTLSEFVDFAAVRENLKAELRRTVGASQRARERRNEQETASAPDEPEDVRATISSQLAVAMGEALIDQYATPEGVDQALGDRPADEGWSSFLDLAGPREEGARVSVRAEYDGWSDFTVRLATRRPDDADPAPEESLWADILFERQGVWAWRVTGARVSPATIPHLAR